MEVIFDSAGGHIGGHIMGCCDAYAKKKLIDGKQVKIMFVALFSSHFASASKLLIPK